MALGTRLCSFSEKIGLSRAQNPDFRLACNNFLRYEMFMFFFVSFVELLKELFVRKARSPMSAAL